jgi:hypothetical protein
VPQSPHLRRCRATHLWSPCGVATNAWCGKTLQPRLSNKLNINKSNIYPEFHFKAIPFFSLAPGVQFQGQSNANSQPTPAQEDTMTTQIINKNETKTDVAQETSKFTIRVVMTMAAVIGVWALACLIGGLASGGVGNLIKGYVSTIIGY